MSQKIGAVVVGLGIAGRVRVRDLKANTCGLTLRGVVSRRSVDEEYGKSMTFDEALTQENVGAMIISTEPGLHEEYVRRSLQSGKHVLVEYPVALSTVVAKELFQLAEEKGVVLHEENIALLTSAFLTVKAKAQTVKLKSANYKLSGSFNGWLENFEKSGKPFITGVTSIQSMLTLFGDLTVTGGKLDRTDTGYCAQAFLQTSYKSPITITLERQETGRRHKAAVYEFEDGEIIDTEKYKSSGKENLFLQDLEKFYAQIESGVISEEQKQLSIRSMELSEQIHACF